MSGPYDDIINRPRPVSPTHPRMPTANRAAQFSPFAALSGFGSAIKETARLTDARITLGESDIAALDMKLQVLADSAAARPEIAVTYYVPDEKKAGGAYITATGALKKIDQAERTILFASGERIAIHDILDIECGLFGQL